MNSKIEKYISEYLNALSQGEREKCEIVDSFHFCADEDSANTCSSLVRDGIKTATCSMKYWYEHDQETMPMVGQLFVITDWHGCPTSIIKITSVETCQFNQVSAEFAYAEGEGDRSYGYWEKVHQKFFSRECKEIDKEFSDTIELVLERFEVIYK